MREPRHKRGKEREQIKAQKTKATKKRRVANKIARKSRQTNRK